MLRVCVSVSVRVKWVGQFDKHQGIRAKQTHTLTHGNNAGIFGISFCNTSIIRLRIAVIRCLLKLLQK